MNQPTALSPSVSQAAAVLQAGGLVAIPTETVYGLGADARNPEAVQRIFSAKGRPSDHPLIVHLGDAVQMNAWAKEIPDAAWKLAEAFWPGPLTLILRRLNGVPDAVTGGLDTIALRVPDHPVALALLSTFGSGIAAPSANRYGQVSPTSAQDVHEELGESVDLILDGGRCPIGIESTIVDLSNGNPRILRPGKVTEEAIYSVLGNAKTAPADKPQNHPGDKPSHYAPRAQIILASTDDAKDRVAEWRGNDKRVGLLASQLPSGLPHDVTWLPLSEKIDEQAHELYHSLRKADHLGLQVLVAVMPANEGIGRAVCDRLRRAAGLGETSSGMQNTD